MRRIKPGIQPFGRRDLNEEQEFNEKGA